MSELERTANPSEHESFLDEACMHIAQASDLFLVMHDSGSPVGERLLHMADSLLCYIDNVIYGNPDYNLRKPMSAPAEEQHAPQE